jgi:hypothetical protein
MLELWILKRSGMGIVPFGRHCPPTFCRTVNLFPEMIAPLMFGISRISCSGVFIPR